MYESADESVWHIVCVIVIRIISKHPIVFILLPVTSWENHLNSLYLKYPDRVPVPPSLGNRKNLMKSHVWQWLALWPQHSRHPNSSFILGLWSILCSSLLHGQKKPQGINLILMGSLYGHVLASWPSTVWKSNWHYLKSALLDCRDFILPDNSSFSQRISINIQFPSSF